MSDLDIEIVEGEDEVRDPLYSVLDEDETKRAVDWLTKEYEEAEAERVVKKRKWDKWRRQAKALPETDKKEWPFPNSSNVSVPLTRINMQTLYGKMESTLARKKPFWTIKALRDDAADRKRAEFLTKYFKILADSKLDLDLARKRKDILKEADLIGTAWVKVPWTRTKWNFRKESAEDGTVRQVDAVLHDGPEMLLIPPEDVLFKGVWKSIQDAPVFFHDVRLPWHQVKAREAQGVYRDVDRIERWARETPNEQEVERGKRNDLELGMEEIIDITEAYFYWDVNGDGVYEDIIFSIHIESGTVLKQSYNELGIRPFEPVPFFTEAFSIEGTGVGQACDAMQDEVDAIHNMRNDNMKVANMRMLVTKPGGFLKEKEQLYPGKIFKADNPREDVIPIQLGEVYPSSLQAENMTIMYSQKATGMSDTLGGFADQTLKSRDTAIGQQLRASQGEGIFSALLEDVVDSFSRIGMLIYFQLVKNREFVVSNERLKKRLSDEEVEQLDEILAVPLEEIPFRLTFTIQTSDMEQTFEVRRQNMLTLTQLFTQYATQVTPLVMQLFGPQGMQMAQVAPDMYKFMLEIYTGSTKLLSNVFKFFGEDDIENYVPDTKKAEALKQMLEMMQGQAGMMGQGPGQAQMGPPPQPGIEGPIGNPPPQQMETPMEGGQM